MEKLKEEVLCGQFYIFSVRGEQHSSVCNNGFGQRKQASQKGGSRRLTPPTWLCEGEQSYDWHTLPPSLKRPASTATLCDRQMVKRNKMEVWTFEMLDTNNSPTTKERSLGEVSGTTKTTRSLQCYLKWREPLKRLISYRKLSEENKFTRAGIQYAILIILSEVNYNSFKWGFQMAEYWFPVHFRLGESVMQGGRGLLFCVYTHACTPSLSLSHTHSFFASIWYTQNHDSSFTIYCHQSKLEFTGIFTENIKEINHFSNNINRFETNPHTHQKN